MLSCGRGCLVAPQADAPLSLAGLERTLVPTQRWPFGDVPPCALPRAEGADRGSGRKGPPEPAHRLWPRARAPLFSGESLDTRLCVFPWVGGTDGRKTRGLLSKMAGGTVTSQTV